MNKGRRDWIDVTIAVVAICSGLAIFLLLMRFFNSEAAQLEKFCEGWNDRRIVDGVLIQGAQDWRDHCRLLTSNLRMYVDLVSFLCFGFGYGVYRLVKDVMFWRDPEAKSKS